MNNKDLICIFCYKNYSTLSNLKRHINNNCILKKIKEENIQIESNNKNLVNYGDEKVELIKKDIYKNILNINKLLLTIIEILHFNNNHNIYYPNNKERFIEVYKNNNWLVYDKNTFLISIIKRYLNLISDNIDIEEKSIIVKKFNNYNDNFNSYYNYYYKNYYFENNIEIDILKKDIIKLFLLKRNIIKKYYNKNKRL